MVLASYPLVWRMLGFLPYLFRVVASMYYLEELARTSMSIAQLLTKEERSQKGKIMSGISLYERLLEYYNIFEQKLQGFVPGLPVVGSQCSLLVIVHSLREEGCSELLSTGGING